MVLCGISALTNCIKGGDELVSAGVLQLPGGGERCPSTAFREDSLAPLAQGLFAAPLLLASGVVLRHPLLARRRGATLPRTVPNDKMTGRPRSRY